MTRKHWTSASTANPLVSIFNKYLYDWVGRKQKTWEQITNGSSAPDTLRLVSNTTYNEIGQMAFKKLDSKDSVNFMQSINYKYNERGWLLSSSTSLFAMTLYYNTNAGNKAYNGNIMYQYWGVPGNLSNHYTYTYDQLNRLTSGITSADNYQESGITYDTQGNLTALNRYQAGTEIDQLSYSYTVSGNPTNQLQTVVDANASNSGLVSGTTNYTYDGNGNMLTAANTINSGQNKSINYNIFNLPNVVTIPIGTYTYTYDAAGNKLRTVKVINGVTTYIDYIGGIQYSGSPTESIAFIQTEEGKAVPNGTTNYDYNYFLEDNLGNTRVTFGTKTGAAIVYQQDDYYPFGMEILRTSPIPNPKNEYLYNKKELQEDFTEYDYGARFYDPVIGRWTSVDPLAEVRRRFSTYNYVEDNPIKLTDIDGMSDVGEDLNNDIYNAEQRSDNRAADQQLINIASAASAIGNVGAAIAGASGSGQQGGDGDGGTTKKDHTAGKQVPKPSDFATMSPERRVLVGKAIAKMVAGARNELRQQAMAAWLAKHPGDFSHRSPTGPEAIESVFDFDNVKPQTVAVFVAGIATDGLYSALDAGANVVVEQYSLRATIDGFYPVMERGFSDAQELTWLNKGDVWKFGTTQNPLTRYTAKWLKEMNLQYESEFSGSVNQALKLENMKILNYINQNGFLPAGNKIIR